MGLDVDLNLHPQPPLLALCPSLEETVVAGDQRRGSHLRVAGERQPHRPLLAHLRRCGQEMLGQRCGQEMLGQRP